MSIMLSLDYKKVLNISCDANSVESIGLIMVIRPMLTTEFASQFSGKCRVKITLS